MQLTKDHAGDVMPSIIVPDLDMTVSRALKVIMGYCNKHKRCEDGCKLYQEKEDKLYREGDCALMHNYSPCDWEPIIKAVKEQEDEDE